ncbi:MAG: histidinol-phosphate transaminase [Myxococcales bacterium]|nr:histidinol-phosphate transaminase [Myxococcales bacterium]
MAVSNVKPEVRALKAYTLKRQDCRIKLNQNESPFDLPEALKETIVARVRRKPWNRYPDFHPEDVLARLGERHGLPAAGVLIGNGSNELLQATFQAIIGPGTRISLPSPTFSLYAMMARANGGEVEHIDLKDDLSYDVAAYQRAADANDRHLLICNPNNPTGSWVAPEVIADLCARTERLVLVDEAYIEFAGEGRSCAPLIERFDNLIVLRTFSKALGLAGIRFGYALGAPDLMTEISKIKLPYNVGHFALEAIRVVLTDLDLIAPTVAEIVSERARVAAALSDLGVEVFPSVTNFLLFRHPQAAALWSGLVEQGVLIRDVSHYPHLADCLRVTLGARAENDAFLDALRAALKEIA